MAEGGYHHPIFGTVMDLGEIVFEKPANQVLSDDRIQELYLGKRKKK